MIAARALKRCKPSCSQKFPPATLNLTFKSMTTTATSTETRPPVPPFSYDDAVKKVRMAENAWNTRDPHKVCWKSMYTAIGRLLFVAHCFAMPFTR